MNMAGRLWDSVRIALAAERERESRLRPDETRFLPAALEIIETPVSPTARVTAWVLLGAIVFTLAWMILGKVDIVVSAPGRLSPAAGVKLIQPAEAGIVRAILVRDGQRVRAGQSLVQLDPTIPAAEAAQARKALEAASLEAARARAILGGLDGRGFDYAAPAGASREVVEVQAALARAQLSDIEATIRARRDDQHAATASRQQAQIQVAKLTETLPLIDQQIAANEELLSKGYVSKLRVLEMRRQRLALERERDAAMREAARTTAQLARSASSVAQTAAEERARVLDALARAETEIKLRREELTKATQRSELKTLVSPVDGTVAQLAIHTVGGVVEPAKPIMIVVPRNDVLVADVRIPNRDIGFVAPGQEVTIKVDAFPFTQHGTLKGRIETIASDAVSDEKLGLVYPARIAMDAPDGGGRNGQIRIAAGMQVTSDIRTGRRSILSYVLSPIDQARQEAGRER